MWIRKADRALAFFVGSEDQANTVAIQADGRIVAAGYGVVSGNCDFALARYSCIRRASRPTSTPVLPVMTRCGIAAARLDRPSHRPGKEGGSQ
jgi:hypothetical protein